MYKRKNNIFILSDERYWLKCWIVFEKLSDNCVKEVYRDKYKKNCINWIKNH